ncbi:MAG TPA: metal-dependent hydrolase [Candidatus Acidoferrales bacterium]|nr:metal-dependent hydrolase [Candidatus Acidoferrales bacterium]
MDPVTHALSGALAARAFLPQEADARVTRTTRWVLILGAIFPDIDVVAKPFDPDNLATIRIHRSLTHSLVCLPVWAILFALLAVWFCRRFKIPAPPWRTVALAFGAGIGLHILFDCITSFGTMVWSPISWTRVQWDWTFIVDLTLTGVLLFFLLLSWVAEGAQRRNARAALMLVLMGALVAVFAVGSYTLARPMPAPAAVATLVFVALPLLASLMGRPLRLPARSWCRLGVLATAAYLGMDAWAHHRALELVQRYAAAENLEVLQTAAIPMPPNLAAWQGFARTPNSVEEWTISLSGASSAPLARSVTPIASGEPCPPVLWTIPQVRAWTHFARFPVVACSQSQGAQAAEFTDLRFRRPAMRWDEPGAAPPIPFTWRVTFDPEGRVTGEGWVIR